MKSDEGEGQSPAVCHALALVMLNTLMWGGVNSDEGEGQSRAVCHAVALIMLKTVILDMH